MSHFTSLLCLLSRFNSIYGHSEIKQDIVKCQPTQFGTIVSLSLREDMKIKENTDGMSLTISNNFFIDTTGAGSYLCELCGRCFLSRTVLAYHYRSTHKLQPAGSPLHNPPRCEDVVATQDAASENGCLGLLLVLEPETRVPLDNQDGKCVDIDSVAVPDSGVLPKNTSPGGFDCPICGKVFQKHRLLQRHSETHRPRRDFLCERCGKTFASRSRLVAHRQRHMAAPRVYSCPQCEFRSALPALAQAHRQLHAAGCQRCSLCGNVYTDRATLRKHMRVHAQERPYECSQPGCGWRFKVSESNRASLSFGYLFY